MKMQVISTNFDSHRMHPSAKAWENSRPDHERIPLGDILKLDLPVNEIPYATIFVESTILEREIFVTLRNHVMWAQTSRVQNILEFDYPLVFEEKDYLFFEEQRELMQEEADHGIRQDEYRKHLPIMSNTKYTISISMRQLVKLRMYFAYLAENIPHLKKLFHLSASTIQNVLINYFSMRNEEIYSYKKQNILNEIKIEQDGRVGDTIVVSSVMPLSLRAQLARHRQILLQDDLLSLMKDEAIVRQTNELEVLVQVSGLAEDWKDIIRKRSCWIAQYDLWSELLNKAIKYLDMPENELLPCSGGKCPYDGDAEARYTKQDPNAPCPIHAKLTGPRTGVSRGLTTGQIEEMNKQAELDGRSEFWFNEIQSFNNGD